MIRSGSARKALYSQGLQDHAVTKAGLAVCQSLRGKAVFFKSSNMTFVPY